MKEERKKGRKRGKAGGWEEEESLCPSHTIYQNELAMDHRPKCNTSKYETANMKTQKTILCPWLRQGFVILNIKIINHKIKKWSTELHKIKNVL